MPSLLSNSSKPCFFGMPPNYRLLQQLFRTTYQLVEVHMRVIGVPTPPQTPTKPSVLALHEPNVGALMISIGFRGILYYSLK